MGGLFRTITAAEARTIELWCGECVGGYGRAALGVAMRNAWEDVGEVRDVFWDDGMQCVLLPVWHPAAPDSEKAREREKEREREERDLLDDERRQHLPPRSYRESPCAMSTSSSARAKRVRRMKGGG
eukprot:3675917-Rhodomonas_salina.1